MTDKEYQKLKVTCLLIIGLFAGLLIGSLATGLRYDSEIRTDQVELKEDVAEIKDDKRVIQDLATELLSQIESAKADRKSLEELRKRLSKGEGNVKK